MTTISSKHLRDIVAHSDLSSTSRDLLRIQGGKVAQKDATFHDNIYQVQLPAGGGPVNTHGAPLSDPTNLRMYVQRVEGQAGWRVLSTAQTQGLEKLERAIPQQLYGSVPLQLTINNQGDAVKIKNMDPNIVSQLQQAGIGRQTPTGFNILLSDVDRAVAALSAQMPARPSPHRGPSHPQAAPWQVASSQQAHGIRPGVSMTPADAVAQLKHLGARPHPGGLCDCIQVPTNQGVGRPAGSFPGWSNVLLTDVPGIVAKIQSQQGSVRMQSPSHGVSTTRPAPVAQQSQGISHEQRAACQALIDSRYFTATEVGTRSDRNQWGYIQVSKAKLDTYGIDTTGLGWGLAVDQSVWELSASSVQLLIQRLDAKYATGDSVI